MPAVRTTSTSTRRLDDFPSVLNWTGQRSISRERCSELEQEDGWNRDESIKTRSIHAQDGHVSLSVLECLTEPLFVSHGRSKSRPTMIADGMEEFPAFASRGAEKLFVQPIDVHDQGAHLA